MWPGYSGLTDLQKQTQEKVALSHGWAWPEDKMKKTSEKLNQNPKMKENSPLETLHLFSFPSKMIGLLCDGSELLSASFSVSSSLLCSWFLPSNYGQATSPIWNLVSPYVKRSSGIRSELSVWGLSLGWLQGVSLKCWEVNTIFDIHVLSSGERMVHSSHQIRPGASAYKEIHGPDYL